MDDRHRELCELELTTAERQALRDGCVLLGIDPREWHEHSMTRTYWSSVAVRRLELRMGRAANGESRWRILWLACSNLGLNPKTVNQRLARIIKSRRNRRQIVDHGCPSDCYDRGEKGDVDARRTDH